VAGTSVFDESRSSNVALETVTGSSLSLNVAVTLAFAAMLADPPAGEVAVIVGGVVSCATWSVNTTSTQ
jgi:hypothetical protein